MTPKIRNAASGAPDELAEVVRTGLGEIPTASGAGILAFTTNVVRFVQEWLAHREGTNLVQERDALFIFSERPRFDGEPVEYERIRHFSREPRRDVCGRIYICAANLQEVYSSAHEAETLDDVAAAAEAARLGSRPAVIFSPALRRVFLCPGGVCDDGQTCELEVFRDEQSVTVPAVDEFLDRFHEIHLRTPQRYRRFWTTPGEYVPVPNAEWEIEQAMVPMAMLRFGRGNVVRYEEEMLEGRADVTIMPYPGCSGGSAVLELKALRSKYPPRRSGTRPRACSNTTNEDAVVEGIEQTDRFRRERRCTHGFLCCYDFREQPDSAFLDRFRDIAIERNVLARHFSVYNEASASRSARPDSAHRAARARGLGREGRRDARVGARHNRTTTDVRPTASGRGQSGNGAAGTRGGAKSPARKRVETRVSRVRETDVGGD